MFPKRLGKFIGQDDTMGIDDLLSFHRIDFSAPLRYSIPTIIKIFQVRTHWQSSFAVYLNYSLLELLVEIKNGIHFLADESKEREDQGYDQIPYSLTTIFSHHHHLLH